MAEGDLVDVYEEKEDDDEVEGTTDAPPPTSGSESSTTELDKEKEARPEPKPRPRRRSRPWRYHYPYSTSWHHRYYVPDSDFDPWQDVEARIEPEEGNGTVDAAMRAVSTAWRDEDLAPLLPHVAQGTQIEIYDGLEKTDSISAKEFLEVAQQAFDVFDTVNLEFGRAKKREGGVYCRATHVLVGPDGVTRTAKIGYHFYKPADSICWLVGKVNVDVSEVNSAACFIATAAYGTPTEKHVMVLRRFRDRRLLTSPGGRLLVAACYRLSPPLAAEVRRSPKLAAVVRQVLTPIALDCELLMEGADG